MLDVVAQLLTHRFIQHPIFIVGLGRSGTTALYSGLVKHPQVLGARVELPFIGYLSHLTYAYEFAADREWLLQNLSLSKPNLDKQLRRLTFEVALGQHYGLYSLLRAAARGDWNLLAKRHWCAKAFLTYEEYQGVAALYPQAKIVYILRNGCDVVHSRTKFKGFAQREFSHHCQVWAENIIRYRYIQNLPNGIKIYQEDLIATPEIVYEKVFDVVGLPPHDAPSHFVRNTLIHPLDEATKRDINVKEVLTTRPLAHADWNAEQRHIFKEICSEAMQEAGYDMPF